MENIGNIFKTEREKNGLLLRQVASAIDIDLAVLRLEKEDLTLDILNKSIKKIKVNK